MTALAAPEDHPLTVRLLYSPHKPEPRQQAFLKLGDLGILEALYGGAAGGGKSDCLLMAALQYVDVPGYAALLLRRSYADLALPGAIMDRSKQWLMGSRARWSEVDFRWTFPSGASLSFGYLRRFNDVYRYQSAEFQFIGFDELTQFTEAEYRYLFTRLRRPSAIDPDQPLARVPIRMRSASNPGGIGHEWVKRRLVQRKTDPDDPKDTPARARKRIFIPAKLTDNPHVDQEEYIESLSNIDPYLRAQMLDGDWDAREPGDWVYDQSAITEAENLGKDYDLLLAEGRMPPPYGDILDIGIDWGEHTGALILWPLEHGGIYIAAECVLEGMEPGAAAEAIFEQLDLIYRLGSKTRPDDYDPLLTPAELLAANRRPVRYPPALPKGRKPLTLVPAHRYDAAGVQSMRTYMKAVRRVYPRAKSTSVPFGAPTPSGKTARPRSYKVETIAYVRRLLERTLAGDDIPAYVQSIARDNWTAKRIEQEEKRIARAGKIAFSARCETLIRQVRKTEWHDREAGTVRKGDDHNHDAMIAGVAPRAIRNR